MIPDRHWSRDNGARVVYNPAGVAAVRQLLGLPTRAEKKEGGADDIHSLRIHRFTKNPRIVEAVDESSRSVRVRILHHQRKHLAIGMQVHARPVGDPANGLFELQLTRSPSLSHSPPTQA